MCIIKIKMTKNELSAIIFTDSSNPEKCEGKLRDWF